VTSCWSFIRQLFF